VLLAGLQADPGGGPTGVLSDGRTTHFVDFPTKVLSPIATSTTTSTTWQLADGTSQPGNARAVYVTMQLILNVTANTPRNIEFFRDVSVGGPDGSTTNLALIANVGDTRGFVYAAINATYALEVTVRVPLAYTSTSFVGVRTFNLIWVHGISAGPLTYTIVSRLATIKGWELGP
jgi:hypothetical protein